MSAPSGLRERIRQFEAMNAGSDGRPLQSRVPNRDRPRPSYPPIPRVQPSLVGLDSSTSSPPFMDDPISPTAASYTTIQPTVPYVPRKPRIKSPSPSPPTLGCQTSLINLRDSNLEDRTDWFKISKPAIAPPLPPRITSQNSGTSVSISSTRSWSPQSTAPSMQSQTSSNSLTVEHTYPPLRNGSSNSNLRQRQGHVPASSSSSFHSVSLSSDGDMGTEGTSTDVGISVSKLGTSPSPKSAGSGNGANRDGDAFDDSFSFETVSSTEVASPTLSSTHEWEKDFATQNFKFEPPKLPSRRPPLGKTPSASSSSNSILSSPPTALSQKATPTLNPVRRIPPPPPSRFNKPPPSASSRASVMSTTTSTSDRSSLFSIGTGTTAHTSVESCTQLLRPTPVPLVARKRYEAVFSANVNTQRRLKLKKLSPPGSVSTSTPASPTTPRKGWRGVSVDLTTNPEENPITSNQEDDLDNCRLEGHVVKTIWSRSKLFPEKLRDIWNACAFPRQNSLDKDGFVKGMWRIDEELRRVQTMRSSTMTMTIHSRRTTAGSLLH